VDGDAKSQRGESQYMSVGNDVVLVRNDNMAR
jgi:hypothetical protein